MRRLKTFGVVGISLSMICATAAADENPDPLLESPAGFRTDRLGDADVPSKHKLAEMQNGAYILRARNGNVTRVAAQKALLPRDPKGHPQGGLLYKAGDDRLYAKLATSMFKSVDGGRIWKPIPLNASINDKMQVLSDGTFVRITFEMEKAKSPAVVYRSANEGRTWNRISEIPIDVEGGYDHRYSHWRMTRLPDDSLLFGVDLHREMKFEGERWISLCTSGASWLAFYRSEDGGATWAGPTKMTDWGSEGGICRLPSGKLLASIRYQRPLLPSDPQDMLARWDLQRYDGTATKFPYKHVFLAESNDAGLSWEHHRQLTTVHGQCYSYPAALSDGTVVVVHDTRYGPGADAARALVSHDEGKTWEDEVYYVYYGTAATGYSHSVVLSDDTIVTLAGLANEKPSGDGWSDWIGHSDFCVVRWRPVKRAAKNVHRQRSTEQSSRKIRVGLIKSVPAVWDLEANWNTFEELAKQAIERGAQLICTPEGFLDGYPIDYDKPGLSEERLRQASQTVEGDNYLRRAKQFAQQHSVHLVFGFSERAKAGNYNAAALIDDDGKLLGCYHKTHLLNGEERWFLPGKELPVWQTKLGKIGIMICMDRNFPEVPRTLKLRGAELIMVPSYGGWSLANEWKMKTRAYDNECFMCFTHPHVSFIVGPRGKVAEKLEGPLPGVLVYDIDLSATTKIKTPHRRPELYEP